MQLKKKECLPEGYHSGWDGWIAENLIKGVPRSKVQERLCERGFGEAFVQARIEKVLSDPLMQLARRFFLREQKYAELFASLSYLREINEPGGQVETTETLNAKDFYGRFVLANRPVLIKGLVRGWPALSKWSPDYFLQALGDIPIDITDGREEDARYEENFQQHANRTSLSSFVERLKQSGVTNNFYLCAKNDLLGQPKSGVLLQDFDYPPGYLSEAAPKSDAGLWVGPAGTWTALHHDASNILFTQVRGTKSVRLIAPIFLPRVYNSRSCWSDIDVRALDFTQFPLMKGVPILEALVCPGDALLIPTGWLHAVESIEPSISLSFTNFKHDRRAHIWRWRPGLRGDPHEGSSRTNADFEL
jgi:hypothetical protein